MSEGVLTLKRVAFYIRVYKEISFPIRNVIMKVMKRTQWKKKISLYISTMLLSIKMFAVRNLLWIDVREVKKKIQVNAK